MLLFQIVFTYSALENDQLVINSRLWPTWGRQPVKLINSMMPFSVSLSSDGEDSHPSGYMTVIAYSTSSKASSTKNTTEIALFREKDTGRKKSLFEENPLSLGKGRPCTAACGRVQILIGDELAHTKKHAFKRGQTKHLRWPYGPGFNKQCNTCCGERKIGRSPPSLEH